MTPTLATSRLQHSDESLPAAGDGPSIPGGLVDAWGAIDPVVLAAVAASGVILLFFGARILRPAVVLGAASVGALLGLRLAAATRSELLPAWIMGIGIPPFAWVVGLPLLAGLAAIAVARLALAMLLGIAVASIVLVLGLLVAGSGDRPDSSFRETTVSWVQEAAPPGSGAISDQIAEEATDRVAETMRDRIEFMAEGLVGDLPSLDPEIPLGVQRWWGQMTEDLPPASIDLVLALASVSGICAVLLGLLLPDRVAMVATAVAGAWLLAAAAAGAWARFGDGSAPPIVPSLVGVTVLAALGLVAQMRTVPASSPGSGR